MHIYSVCSVEKKVKTPTRGLCAALFFQLGALTSGSLVITVKVPDRCWWADVFFCLFVYLFIMLKLD